MTGLLFTTDGELRERAQEGSARALARVAEPDDGSAPRLLCGEAEHEIVALPQGGWAFELRDRDGRSSGGFQPFRLRRGGRLQVQGAGASLHGRPWSHEGWTFSAPDGRRVDATVTLPGAEPRACTGAAVSRTASFVVVLEASVWPEPEPPVSAGVLALGCWLIARWHRTPAGDHVLTAGARAAGGNGRVPTGGIRTRTAN